MKILYVSIILLLSVQAKKEQLSRLQDIFNDPEIMRIVKKLGLSEEDLTPPKENNIDKSASETLPDRPTPELPVRPTTAQPEHVTDSVGNSCFYTSHESTIIRSKESTQAGSHFLRSDKYRTRYDCIKSCCYTQGCTLAVFENKDNNTCYLFNCGPDSKCVYARLGSYVSMTLKESSVVHGGRLGQDNEGDLKGLGEETPQPTPTPKPTPVPQKTPVRLYGDCDASQGDKCMDFNAKCKEGICQCNDRFQADQDICYFHGSGKPKPAITDQSGDEAPKQPMSKLPVQTKKDGPFSHPKASPSPEPPKSKVETEDKVTQEEPKPETPKVTEVTTNTETKPAPKTAPQLSNKTVLATTNTSKSATENTSKKPAKQERVEVEFGEEDVVIVASPTDSSQGPIVALALGLAVTMMLLVYVGCRLRNVKKRIRKGRALHSNEADYLINGMYL